ncbi:MAG: Transcriptional regulator, TraR/DksA family [Candidatus Jorgensenbacteria bacterium GW2011_GWA1_48_13]|uniref:Transcriptional regulator, TraR/DksA family n=2 Tax=Candidatus Joergenseniibacteriota TaxID=1752739 RepID=A0A0G1W9M5_9BACT|nr:MAG: Transcriptional regulator, TraR/DksA family [Candidatus Jorgensenbacteria bacterium GW2011_GWA1_48_13]KKU99395.1 MAG: Transcriptional regulator, TraR/DksA family [Candidatus Jorgensenbacteria bacterium GW2011_GWC1_48_8]KKW15280.1 MAG: Transcriptional regulator, TraR/DksA family [Candidatus Jorgensenbacteria bacterium GW2011_GWB1_50_10]
MSLSEKQIKEFETRLLAEKKEIEEGIEKMRADLDFGDDTDHLDEEADETEEMTKFIGVKKPLEEKMAAIDVALERIKNGTYDKCESCGKEIELEVLEAAPESGLCKSCKIK